MRKRPYILLPANAAFTLAVLSLFATRVHHTDALHAAALTILAFNVSTTTVGGISLTGEITPFDLINAALHFALFLAFLVAGYRAAFYSSRHTARQQRQDQ